MTTLKVLSDFVEDQLSLVVSSNYINALKSISQESPEQCMKVIDCIKSLTQDQIQEVLSNSPSHYAQLTELLFRYPEYLNKIKYFLPSFDAIQKNILSVIKVSLNGDVNDIHELIEAIGFELNNILTDELSNSVSDMIITIIDNLPYIIEIIVDNSPELAEFISEASFEVGGTGGLALVLLLNSLLQDQIQESRLPNEVKMLSKHIHEIRSVPRELIKSIVSRNPQGIKQAVSNVLESAVESGGIIIGKSGVAYENAGVLGKVAYGEVSDFSRSVGEKTIEFGKRLFRKKSS